MQRFGGGGGSEALARADRDRLEAFTMSMNSGRALGACARRDIMDESRALDSLRQSKPALFGLFGVTRVALFGSTARGVAREDGDVDVPVAFDERTPSQRDFGVQFYLEDLLGHPVDLVGEKALRAELRPFVQKDAVFV